MKFVADERDIDQGDTDVFFEDVLAFEFCTRRGVNSDFLKLHDDLQSGMPATRYNRFEIWELLQKYITKSIEKEMPLSSPIIDIDLMIMRNYKRWNQLFVNIVKLANFVDGNATYQYPDSLKTLDSFKLLSIAYSFQPITGDD